MKMKPLSIFCGLCFLLAGCVGSPVHTAATASHNSSVMKRNNAAMLNLRVGMTGEEVRQLMGPPERSEGYAWGTCWFYRTAINGGAYATLDSDFTPVVINPENQLVGWGRNFYMERVSKSQVEYIHR